MTKTGPIEFTLRARHGSKPICDHCGMKGATYDQTTTRRFEFVPLWAIAVFFVYRMRRVNCRKCGVTTERVPWACGNNQQTISYRIFLATWAKRLSWQETAAIFGTSWDSVYRAIQWVVRWGIIHIDSADEAKSACKQVAMTTKSNLSVVRSFCQCAKNGC